ncbi:MAG: bacillithiol biosynthesis deacetylase BshB2 [Bacillaceae bacterium]|nr:bacillithiol biosynthesis deacetylase BshB2 [Bacillaceae bacterium]
MNKHLLVIFPHPDDESFGASGTIAHYRREGIPVTYVCATLGEMGRGMGNPPFANRETLPQIRKKELEEACRVLDIQDLRLLGLRDKTLEFEDLDELADRIGAIIQEIDPHLIMTFYPGYSVHPDHDTCGAAVIRAVEKMPADKRPTVHCVAFSKNCVDELGKADVVRDVSDVEDKKVAAIKAHRSQVEGYRGGLKEKLDNKDPETMRWLLKERFWTYRFDR